MSTGEVCAGGSPMKGTVRPFSICRVGKTFKGAPFDHSNLLILADAGHPSRGLVQFLPKEPEGLPCGPGLGCLQGGSLPLGLDSGNLDPHQEVGSMVWARLLEQFVGRRRASPGGGSLLKRRF